MMRTPKITILGTESPCSKTYASGRRRGQPCANTSQIRIDGVAYCGLHARSEMLEYGSPHANEIMAMAEDADLGCEACSRLYATHTYTEGSYGWGPQALGVIGSEVGLCGACYERYTRCIYLTYSPEGEIERCNEQATHPGPPRRSIFSFSVFGNEDDHEDGVREEDETPAALRYCEAHHQIALAEQQQKDAESEARLAEYEAAAAEDRELALNDLLDWMYPRIVERLKADKYLS